ncbi:MAG TPA: hypothetical protein VI386_16995 [Candidatus Sulfotelmatobacter sp.]
MSEYKSARRVELIWNKGIGQLCDRRFPDEFAAGQYSPIPTLAGALTSSKLPGDLIANPEAHCDIQDGELVWVRLSWLKSFVTQILPRIKGRFVLITGDSDSCVPSEVMLEARSILACRNIVHWYTQNYDCSMQGERISPIPIGIDFHMLSERPMWGEEVASPAQQEDLLESIRGSLPPLAHRIPKVYVDFAWQQSFGLRHYRRFHPLKGTKSHDSRRRIARTMMGNESAFCQPGPLRRSHMWQERGQYAFVLSPHGMGLDCHRTWEALALGHIVLVPSSSLDSLYVDLPVIPLKSWDDITPDALTSWHALLLSIGGRREKLKSQYWIGQMRQAWDRC